MKQIILWITVAAIIVAIAFLNRGNTPAVNSDIEVMEVKDKSGLPPAKEIVEPAGFINVDSINITEHIGEKVILVDFWTYSCINCQRTLPYLTAWDEKYRDQGLLIIGVHSPEFEFEKDYDNVVEATERFNINYPVVLDNDFKTWRAYNNRYWPRKYIIDIDGFIVYDHIGEGAYDETEEIIQELLEERKQKLELDTQISDDMTKAIDRPEFSQIRTPELYIGYSRGKIGNPQGYSPGEVLTYEIPSEIEADTYYLSGDWLNEREYLELESDGIIKLQYKAKDVNIVLGAAEPVQVQSFVDGKLHKTLTIQDEKLYNVVTDDDYSDHTLELVAEPGLRAYAFTFG